MGLKNKKIVPLLLISSIIGTNISLTSAYAYNSTDIMNNHSIKIDDYKIVETSDGFIMEYEKVENNETVYYYEKVENNEVYTKKYIKENEELKLIEELTTTFKTEIKNDGSEVLKAEINNITNNTTIDEVVMEQIINKEVEKESLKRVRRAVNIRRHPRDNNYVFFTGISSHLGFSRLTKAAVVGALAATVGGGKSKAAAVSAIATLVLNGGYSNLYYSKDSYFPIKKKGNPTVKYVTKYYLDKKYTKQVGKTVYTDSGIYNK